MGTYILYTSSFLVSAAIASEVVKYYNRIGKENIKAFPKALFLLLITLLPVFLSSIRKGIGIDYSTYEIIFNRYKDAPLSTFLDSKLVYEVGNYAIIKIGYLLFHDVQGIFALYAILTICFFAAAVLYYRDRISIFVGFIIMYFLFYSGSLNTVRQYLSISIVAFAYRYIEERKLLKYILLIAIASTIHSTAAIMLFIYFLYSSEDGGKEKGCGINKYLTRFLVVLLLVSPVLISGLITVLSNVAIFSRYFETYEVSSINITTSIILKLPVYIPLILMYRRNVYADRRNKFYYVLLLLEFELLLTSTYFKWGFRLSYFAIFGQVVLIAFSIRNEKNKWNRIIYRIYYLTWYSIQFWLLYFVWERDAIVPFVHIFM